jgi:hypothetical protein
MKYLFFILGSLFSAHLVHGQKANLKGTVTDSLNNGIPFASVALLNAADSSNVAFDIAQESGKFSFPQTPYGRYLVMVASVGYRTTFQEVNINAPQKSIKIKLAESGENLDEVMVSAKRIPILIKGDTVVYNTESFKTQSNATVEDLIRKMPGIQVESDGTVTAEGEQVTKVMINGKEFFGGNVQAATKNLDADLIDQVEVIDRKTDEDEFTGEENNEREKVINLVLKKEHLKGYFGRLNVGYGLNDEYTVHGNLNFFRDETQVSLIGGLNNINRSLYGWQEMSTLNSFDISPFNQNNSMTWWSGGVTTYRGGGINVHTEPIKGMRTDISFVLTDNSQIRTSERNNEVFLPSRTLFSDRLENNTSDNKRQEINFKTEYEPDTLNRIVIRAKVSSDLNISNQFSRAHNFLSLAEVINSATTGQSGDVLNQKVITKIHWTRKSKNKPKNRFLASVYYGYSDLNSEFLNEFQQVDSILLPFPQGIIDPNLKRLLNTQERTVATTWAYQFQITDKLWFRPGFNHMFSQYDHAFEWEEDGEVLMPNSPNGSVTAHNMEYFAHFSYQLDSFTNIHFVPELNQSIEDRRFQTDDMNTFRFNQVFFIPYIFIRSQKQHVYKFNANFRANLDRPRIQQVLPVVDNTNPYNTRTGNIELQNNLRYSSYYRFYRFFGLGKNFFFSGWNSFNANPVVSVSRVTEENIAVTTLENYKNSYWTNQNFGINLPIKFLKANLELGGGYSNSRSYFIQNEQEIEIKNQDLRLGPELSFNAFEKWSLTLEYDITRHWGQLNKVQNNAFINQDIYIELLLTPHKRFEWRTDLNWEFFGENNAVPALNIPILSSQVNVFLDKKQSFSLGVEAFDILDKNQNIWRWWETNSFTQNSVNAVERYFLLTLTYKIKKPDQKG